MLTTSAESLSVVSALLWMAVVFRVIRGEIFLDIVVTLCSPAWSVATLFINLRDVYDAGLDGRRQHGHFGDVVQPYCGVLRVVSFFF